MTNRLRLCNVQPGYAECYTDTHAGWVDCKEIRVSLDLESGKERTAQRWFPSEDGDIGHWKTGYATMTEALMALAKWWDEQDEYAKEEG